ncbi:MAG: hypothetical protein E7445_02320 [Ruminococcaceae bacterium]|nr:hypothetical protein [Oscillospiraceae bacterium]
MQETYRKLREELEGCRQIMALDQAVLAAVLTEIGEVTVRREDIRRHLQENRQVRAAYDPEAGTYTLRPEGADGLV